MRKREEWKPDREIKGGNKIQERRLKERKIGGKREEKENRNFGPQKEEQKEIQQINRKRIKEKGCQEKKRRK